jgi:hypothetical protein
LVALTLETGDVPADDDYAAVAEALNAAPFDPAQDRVVILPPWSLRPLVALKHLPWITGDHLATRPAHRLRDLYLVVEPDADADLEAIEARWGWPELIAKAGDVQLMKLSTGAPTVVDDLAARLTTATIQLTKGGTITPCDKRSGDGFRCEGRKGWQRVSRERRLVTENGDLVVWAHPPPKGERLEITWPGVALDEQLIIRAGFARKGANWAKAPVRLRVRVGDEEIASLEREPAFDFRADIVDTQAFAGQKRPVTFWIDTRNNSKAHFAFDAFTAKAKR